MKSLFKILYILSLISSPLLASTPTEEGLFRNGDNADIKGDLITYKIKLHSITPPEDQSEIINSSDNNSDLQQRPIDKSTSPSLKNNLNELTNFIKVIAVKKGENSYNYLFLFYSSEDFSTKHLLKVLPVLNEKRIVPNNSNDLTKLNIGLLQMLTLNRSTEIVNYIKSIDPSFKKNSEVINKNKSYLYARYKKYLQTIKENPELKEELENPRAPEDENKREAIAKIEAMPMYLKSDAISLQKSNDTFIWSLNRENIQASFDQRHLFLTSLFIRSKENIRVDVEKFILYDGVHQLPSKYIIELDNKKKITVSMLSYREYPKSSVNIVERVEYYSKQITKLGDKLDLSTFSNLLYQTK